MKFQGRVQRLDRTLPRRSNDNEFQPNFEFRVAGRKRRDCQLELIARAKAAIADPRASAAQRAYWTRCAAGIEAALEPDGE